MRRKSIQAQLLAALLAGCTAGPRDAGSVLGGAGEGAGDTSEDGLPDDGGEDGGDDGGDDGEDGSDGDDGMKFDVGEGTGGDGDSAVGCEKVDLLFVIDNSGSMEDEQANLIASFPLFIATIQSTLTAEDYQIMAVDTDAIPDGGNCNGAPPGCCDSYCAANPLRLCGGTTCPGVPACLAELGSGIAEDPLLNDCGIAGDQRYIVDGQPELAGTFDCIARVGTEGEGNERTMQAMTEAISTLNAPGRCNEGFVRDDAILVITVITDEEDDPNDGETGAGEDTNSPGDPVDWMQAVVDVKHGDPKAVVVLGLVGDTDVPGGLCEPLVDITGAEPAPRLREFVELFGDHGIWGSVCSPDYGAFFAQAVSLIDTACDEFDPPG